MKLSVILPNYNHANFLQETLPRLLLQSYQADEILICDDASTDQSWELIKYFRDKDPRIKAFRNRKNLGVVKTLKKLLAKAQGEYVYGAASDDVHLPEFFQKCMSALTRYPKVALCSGLPATMDGMTGKIREYQYGWSKSPAALNPGQLADAIKVSSVSCGVTSFCIWHRQKFLEAGSYIEELGPLSDWFSIQVMSFRHGIFFMPEAFAYERILPNTFSQTTHANFGRQRKIFAHLLTLLCSEQYKDVYPYFKRSDVLRQFCPQLVRAYIATPEIWNAENLNLINELLKEHAPSIYWDEDPIMRKAISVLFYKLGHRGPRTYLGLSEACHDSNAALRQAAAQEMQKKKPLLARLPLALTVLKPAIRLLEMYRNTKFKMYNKLRTTAIHAQHRIFSSVRGLLVDLERQMAYSFTMMKEDLRREIFFGRDLHTKAMSGANELLDPVGLSVDKATDFADDEPAVASPVGTTIVGLGTAFPAVAAPELAQAFCQPEHAIALQGEPEVGLVGDVTAASLPAAPDTAITVTIQQSEPNQPIICSDPPSDNAPAPELDLAAALDPEPALPEETGPKFTVYSERDAMNILQEVNHGKGFIADFKLTASELDYLRQTIQTEFVSNLREIDPRLARQAEQLGMANYHQLPLNFDHAAFWRKTRRLLPAACIPTLMEMDFLQAIQQEAGKVMVYAPDLMWRLVRPQVADDVGPVHTDKWFWDAGNGDMPEGHERLKVWIPIHAQPGRNGLLVKPFSQLREDWKHHFEFRHGYNKPVLDEKLEDLAMELLPLPPGNLLLFHDGLLHGGAINQGTQCRVSLEVTVFYNVQEAHVRKSA